MSWSTEEPRNEVSFETKDRFEGRGEELIKECALECIELLRSLPLAQAENFAVAVRDIMAELIAK